MLPEHCVHLVHVVMDYFQSLSLENITCKVALCIVQLQNIAPHTTEPDIQEFETERNALYYILTAIWAM